MFLTVIIKVRNLLIYVVRRNVVSLKSSKSCVLYSWYL